MTEEIEIAPEDIVIAQGITRTRDPIIESTAETDNIMALTVEPGQLSLRGLVRVVKSREGNVAIYGFIDRSVLYHAEPLIHPGRWEIGVPANIKGLEQIVDAIQPEGKEFVGLEDPDVIQENGKTHVYFTMPFIGSESNDVFLGHAEGTLDDLVATPPVLSPIECESEYGERFTRGFKELCSAPINSDGSYFHLVESNDLRNGVMYSTVAMVEANTLSGPWIFKKDAIHPDEVGEKYAEFANGDEAYEWCSEHASPCRLLQDEFVSVPRYKVGILNGRSKSENGHYGRFLPGLFLYDPETGQVPWVDPQPLIDDPEAKTIIFASDLILANENQQTEGQLIAHVDDDKVYSYKIQPSAIYERIPEQFR